MPDTRHRLFDFLRPHKTIPHVSWTAKNRWDLNPSRVLILEVALFFFGLGDALLIQSHTGNAPWSVFAQGLSRHTGIALGLCTFIISGVILLLWWPLGERPGFGTISNIVVIAIAIQIGGPTSHRTRSARGCQSGARHPRVALHQ